MRPSPKVRPVLRRAICAISLVCGALVVLVIALGARSVAAEGRRARFHVVESGETLGRIAAKHGVRIDDIAADNDIRPDRPLSVGQKLRIPRRRAPRRHVVRPGETVAQIAIDEGCSAGALLRRNKLGKRARLDVGQVLMLPAPGEGEGSAGRAAPRAEKTHQVRSGEQLGTIARRYGVTSKALMRANRITDARQLKAGQRLVIPDKRTVSARPSRERRRLSGRRRGYGVEHRVMDGQSWKTLARAYGMSIAKLRKANPRSGGRLRASDVVRVPGAKKVRAVPVANCGYPGVPFIKGSRRETIRLLRCGGGVSKRGRRRLSALARGSKAGGGRLLHRRLVRLLQRVSDEYPGRQIRIVSGYRPPGGPSSESRHHHGQAMDFSVQGIGNKTLHSFCRTLPSTGCGFYPNSSFIHMDVRDRRAVWVDRAGPGEAADYAPRGQVEAPEEALAAPSGED